MVIKKLLLILLVAILLLNICANTIYSAIEIDIDRAYIEKIGRAEYHLKYYKEESKQYTYLICDIVGHYDDDGNFNPAYCMNRDLDGAGTGAYYVTTENILEDDAIWRVIKNGYPFKNGKELGLESDYNAFLVTKMAVYCMLGQAKIEYFKAEDDDKEAKAMLNALKKLVDIGENGTEKQNTNPLSSKKIGSLKEDGMYYSQEYQITSTAKFDTYKVKKTKGNDNIIIANTNGEKKETFKENENFKVMIPKENLKNDIDVELEVSAECEAYIILEGKTTVDKKQNYVVTVGETSKATTKINLEQETNNGKIIVKKVDEDTREPIKDVEFKLLDSTGKEVAKKVTDKDGKITFSGLYPGNYTLIETKTNEKYEITEEEFNIELEYNQEKNIEVENKHKSGNLKIRKIDKDNNEIPISGVEFEIYSIDDKKTIGTYKTDENGEIYIQNLKIGEYKIIEKATNKWYNLSETENVEIEWNKTSEIKIENELKKGQVEVEKVDKDNNSIKIEGVKFQVLDKDKNILEEIVTNSEGKATTQKYPLKDYEKIYLKEIETNEKYILNDNLIEITLKENQTEKIVIENEKIKGKIKIVKTTSDKSIVTGKEENTPLEGVVFEIYDINDKFIEQIKTDKNGVALTSELEKGEYKVKEISTNEWYYLNEDVHKVNIEKNDETVELNVKNEPKNPEINVEKSGVDQANVGEQIEYDISVQNTGNTSLDNFILQDIIPTDSIKVTKFNTGTYNQKLNYDLYYKTNLTDDKYILLMEDLNTEENYEIDFEYELAENEYITEIKMDFKTVEKGFCSNENPHMFAIIKEEIKSGTDFTNTAKLSGEYNNYKVTDTSKWKTIAYKVLPRTGF